MKRFRSIEHYISYRMAKMDHGEAIRLGATEKYVLGELPQSLRNEFEEHYFDCQECALDVKAGATFVDAAREIFRLNIGKSVPRVSARARGWFAWFRPAIAVPAFAILLVVIAYQNTVTIPRAKKEPAHGEGQFFTSSFSLRKANERGGEEVKVQVHPNESFALKFDFAPTRTFDSYLCQLQDEAGRSLLQVSVPGSSVNQEAQLVVPAGHVKPGRYSLVFIGDPSSTGKAIKSEVLRLRFVVELE